MKVPWRHHKRKYKGTRIDLRYDGRTFSAADHYRSVMYAICMHDTDQKIGECDIRIGSADNEALYYAGNCGYRIEEKYRGHGYAYDACLMMVSILRKEYDMTPVLITCSPENTASKKIIEKAGGILIDKREVPAWHWLYQRGEKVKLIYRIDG